MAGTSWYVSNCKDCVSIDLKDRNKYDTSEAWCSEYRRYVNPNDRACSNRFKNDDYKNPPSSDCYLTTIVCEILGYPDDCDTLKTLRSFRDEYLKQNEEYIPLLLEYDIVGPKIAEAIRKSLKPDVFAHYLLSNYITPTVKCVKSKNYDLALLIYQYMVTELKGLFHLELTEDTKGKIPTGKGYVKELDSHHHL
jgi:hypothetical protein